MSDSPLFGPDDRVDDVEALLRELDGDDFELVAPPRSVWSGIEAELAGERVGVTSAAPTPRSGRFLAAAAAVVALVAGAVVVATVTRGDDDAVVAAAQLTFDPESFDPAGADASAKAELIQRDGRYEIRLDEAALPQPGADEDLELWLIAVDDDGVPLDVQPVALVDSDDPGTYVVPANLDPDTHSIVDISIEPRDGVETHSGRSILRGALGDV